VLKDEDNSRTYHFAPLFSALELPWPFLCPMFWEGRNMYTRGPQLKVYYMQMGIEKKE